MTRVRRLLACLSLGPSFGSFLPCASGPIRCRAFGWLPARRRRALWLTLAEEIDRERAAEGERDAELDRILGSDWRAGLVFEPVEDDDVGARVVFEPYDDEADA